MPRYFPIPGFAHTPKSKSDETRKFTQKDEWYIVAFNWRRGDTRAQDFYAGSIIPFIGAKRKRVPAVIRQTGCIIDHGIEFSRSLPPSLSSLALILAFSILLPSPSTLEKSYDTPTCTRAPLRQLDMNARRSLLMRMYIYISRIFFFFLLRSFAEPTTPHSDFTFGEFLNRLEIISRAN